jgi:hypothetical protein
MTVLPTYFPESSTTASLQPVRRPGSTPSTALGPKGADSSSLRTFSANTWMAASSATSRRALCTSFSMAGITWARRAKRAAFFSKGAPAKSGLLHAAASNMCSSSSASGSTGARRPPQGGWRGRLGRRGATQVHHQLFLHPAPPHGQVAMRVLGLEQITHRFLVGEVVLELARRLGLLALGGLGKPVVRCSACARWRAGSASSDRRSTMISTAPARAASVSGIFFSSSMKALAWLSGVSPAVARPWAQSHSQLASGSRPASRAMTALVLRFCL